MPRLFGAFMFATVSLLAFGPTAALAASPSEQTCTASGGTFTKENGTVSCTTNVGNSTNSQTTTTGGQGNTDNKTTCSGPGNSTSHC
jgi:hypothetical protein